MFSAPVGMTTSLNLEIGRSLTNADCGCLPSPGSIGTQSVFELSHSEIPKAAEDFVDRLFMSANDAVSADSLSMDGGTLQSCPPSLDLSTYVIGEKFGESCSPRHGRLFDSASSNPEYVGSSPAKSSTTSQRSDRTDKVDEVPPALSLSVDSGCVNESNDVSDEVSKLTENGIKVKAREFGEHCFESDFWNDPSNPRFSRGSVLLPEKPCRNSGILQNGKVLPLSCSVVDCGVKCQGLSPERSPNALDFVVPAPLEGECHSPTK